MKRKVDTGKCFKWRFDADNRSIVMGGYALPTAFAIGLCMISMAVTSVLLAQDGRDSASLRRDNAASVLVTDSAIAEILSGLSLPENRVLLGKSYDPINPRTGMHYLGEDGIPNSGDEGKQPVDEWSNVNLNCTSAMGLTDPTFKVNAAMSPQHRYKVLAYRYHPERQVGDLLVEGIHNDISSYIHVGLEIKPDFRDFPGIMAEYFAFWQGRNILGQNSNLFFNPTLNGAIGLGEKSGPEDSDRMTYLNAVWSGDTDGFTADPIDKNLVACSVELTQSYTVQGQDLGLINTSQTLTSQPGKSYTLSD